MPTSCFRPACNGTLSTPAFVSTIYYSLSVSLSSLLLLYIYIERVSLLFFNSNIHFDTFLCLCLKIIKMENLSPWCMYTSNQLFENWELYRLQEEWEEGGRDTHTIRAAKRKEISKQHSQKNKNKKEEIMRNTALFRITGGVGGGICVLFISVSFVSPVFREYRSAVLHRLIFNCTPAAYNCDELCDDSHFFLFFSFVIFSFSCLMLKLRMKRRIILIDLPSR